MWKDTLISLTSLGIFLANSSITDAVIFMYPFYVPFLLDEKGLVHCEEMSLDLFCPIQTLYLSPLSFAVWLRDVS